MMDIKLPDLVQTSRFLQIASLLNAPIADLDQVKQNDICLIGLFEDHGHGLDFGARFAARQIRYASYVDSLLPLTGNAPRILDLGDLNVFPLERERNRAALIRQIRAIVERGAVPIVVGGAFEMGPILQQVLRQHENMDVGHLQLRGHLEGESLKDGSYLIALTIDMVGWQSATMHGERPLARLQSTIERFPPQNIGAVYLTGLAPELDLCGRYETSLGKFVLEILIAHLCKAKA